MSDNIPPFEIQGEILKRVPDAKSLLKFRSVSKPWKCLIDSPQFIAGYNPQPPRCHILVRYDGDGIRDNYVSIIDNDDNDSHSFSQHKFPLTIPKSKNCELYCSSKGLFCFYLSKNGVVLLWNPSIRKSVTIDVPKVSYESVIGFGVSPYSSDPKLVRIQDVVNVSDNLKPRIVEIYSLSTGEWRTLSSEDVPRSSVAFYDIGRVALGNYIFWHAGDITGKNGMRHMEREMIMLFDMISDKFMEIYLPHSVTKDPHDELSLFKIRESLAVVVSDFYYFPNPIHSVHVWMMEGGVSDSFTKMYSIIQPNVADFSLLAFRNNGHPIIRIDNNNSLQGWDHLEVYEPDTKQFTPIGPSGSISTEYVVSYMETLLLLDR